MLNNARKCTTLPYTLLRLRENVRGPKIFGNNTANITMLMLGPIAWVTAVAGFVKLPTTSLRRTWGVTPERVHQTPIQDVADLEQRLMSTWTGFQHSAVDKQSTNSERLGACVCAYGGHLKQLL